MWGICDGVRICARTSGNVDTSLVSQRRKPTFLQYFTCCIAHCIVRQRLAVDVSALSPFFEKFVSFVLGASRSGSCNRIRAELISNCHCTRVLKCSAVITCYCFQTVVQNFCMMRTHFPMGKERRFLLNLPSKLLGKRLQDTSTTDKHKSRPKIFMLLPGLH